MCFLLRMQCVPLVSRSIRIYTAFVKLSERFPMSNKSTWLTLIDPSYNSCNDNKKLLFLSDSETAKMMLLFRRVMLIKILYFILLKLVVCVPLEQDLQEDESLEQTEMVRLCLSFFCFFFIGILIVIIIGTRGMSGRVAYTVFVG